MVGTSPIVRPWRRHWRDASTTTPGSSNTAKGLSGAVLDLVSLFAWRRDSTVRCVSMFWPGKFAARHLVREPLRSARDLFGKLGVSLDELGRLARGQAEHVVEHQHLAVRAGAGADADRRDAQSLGDAACELARHSLEHDAERSRIFKFFGVGQDPSRLRLALALDFEATH